MNKATRLEIDESQLKDVAEVLYRINPAVRKVFVTPDALRADILHATRAEFSDDPTFNYLSTYGYVVTIHKSINSANYTHHARFSVSASIVLKALDSVRGAVNSALNNIGGMV